MARKWERVDEDTTVGPRFGQDPPPSFSAPTLAYTYRQRSSILAGNSIVAETPAGWMAFETAQRRESDCSRGRHGRCVGTGHAIDLIVEELDRCWEVSQDQDKASKIEKGIYETHRDVKMETTFMSYVTRRKLNFQQLDNVLGTPLPAVIKGYATLRDAKLTECSYDKVVMWTSGSYDYDDVVRALVRLDRPEMRPGKSGHNGKSVLTYFTDPEVDAPTIVPGSELWTIKYGPTTLERDSRTHCKRTSTFARTERRRSHAIWSKRYSGSFLHNRRWTGGN